MSYGWVLLVVLIIIFALVYFGLLSPSRFFPDKPKQIVCDGKGYFCRGSGTPGDPYLINDWTGLNAIRNNLTASYVLIKSISSFDVDYPGIGDEWEPIGTYDPIFGFGTPFKGTFDGNNNIISDLIVNQDDAAAGLFGYINQTEISNIKLTGVNITGYIDVGGLAGVIEFSDIINSSSTGSINGFSNVGGLVGRVEWYSTILSSYSTGDVNGSSGVGGLAGYITYSTILSSYSTGDVNGSSDVGCLAGVVTYSTISNSYSTGNAIGLDYVGGLAGFVASSTISSSYFIGNLTSSSDVGGFMGFADSSIISNSYAIANVNATQDDGESGGFVSENYWSNISNSYSAGVVMGAGNHSGGFAGEKNAEGIYADNNNFWDVEVSGQAISEGGRGKTTAEMKNLLTFLNAGWDIAKISEWDGEEWKIDDGNDYPRLGWQ
jgi:hypothetical protein